ncbi:UNVERIFIED_CONTAM: hypothetical protein GTU68_005808 [Idotea baltica]|nr:hypothetical protein [Idotea baltica]
MAAKAGINASSRVLEVGTGSGFAAAVYTELGAKVYTVEIDCTLAEAARTRLRRLGYSGIQVHCADGMAGWSEEAPFNTIFINLKSRGIPEALVEQLAARGRVLVPIEVQATRLASAINGLEKIRLMI